ncbi:MAG: helix-turn-helix transcriptional regulator [Clostridia bacterium]|nr:helix-turn-helix transcriptional regulator [Clostridia bacterium]
MANRSMGEIISALRREKGMTQRELADMLNITDKAVSKWERGMACPDTQLIPKVAEILGISVEELMNAKAVPVNGHKGAEYLMDIILKAVPMAMGIAVLVIALLGELDVKSGFAMLGIGLACAGAYLLKGKE